MKSSWSGGIHLFQVERVIKSPLKVWKDPPLAGTNLHQCEKNLMRKNWDRTRRVMDIEPLLPG